MNETRETWHLPTIPLKPVDVINRRAAATGSPRYAMLAEYGDYNGHHVTMSYKAHACGGPRWNAEYYWAGRVVLGRGSFAECVRAAKQEYARGARGCTVVIYLDANAHESLDEQRAACRDIGAIEGAEPQGAADGPMTAICDAVSYEMGPNGYLFAGMIQLALKYTGTAEDWPNVRRAWLDSTKPKPRDWSAERQS